MANSPIFTRPLDRIHGEQQHVDDISADLQTAIKNFLNIKSHQLRTAAGRIESLSPLKVLGRGYSVTQLPDGQIIRSVDEIKVGDKIITCFSRGKIQSKIEKIIPEEESNGKGKTEKKGRTEI